MLEKVNGGDEKMSFNVTEKQIQNKFHSRILRWDFSKEVKLRTLVAGGG